MPRGAPCPAGVPSPEAERLASAKLSGIPIRRERMAAVASFVTAQLDDECRDLAQALRRVVLQVEEHGEERRRTLLDGARRAPRRSGRRPRT